MKKAKLLMLGVVASIIMSACGTTIADKIEKSSQSNQPEKETTQDTEPASESVTEDEETPGSYDFTICFAGDICLSSNSIPYKSLQESENGLEDCVSPTFLNALKDADLACINNEFAYSNRGAPLEGKAYTFCADPESVSVLQEMGIDLVTLANNHVFDYGEEALLDTFDTLDSAGISYFGAGRNLEEAKAPLYVELQGKKIAFVGASRAEKHKMTPQATDDSAGILRCYDNELVLEEIKEAKKSADIVLVYVHWGTEYSTKLEKAQKDGAKAYIDAGADVIIGAHPHILQGMEYYKGKPIIYSLGNFWFSKKTLNTMLLNLHFSGDKENEKLEVQILPGIQTKGKTAYLNKKAEREKLFQYLKEISVNITIDENGYVLEEE